MKILVMGFTKPKYMPYMNFYLSNIQAEDNEVHILYWNRDQKAEDLSKLAGYTLHEFNQFQADDVPIYTKIGSFIKYRKFALSIIKKEKFDFIIVLHTLPGVLVFDRLKKYAGRFILDYRDSTYETFPPFKKLIAKLVKWSKVTFVSSDAFRKYLPEGEANKINTSHNILLDSLKHQEDKERSGIPSDKIRVAFWGFIRHRDINLKLIDRLANDNRFEIHYYGREQQIALELKDYVRKHQIDNVFFHGEYTPEERYKFILHTDIIHNIYLDNNMLLAMGNKYYDGIIFRIPQVCMPGSFMSEMCEKYGVGVSLDPRQENFAEKLYEYSKSLNFIQFKESCRKAISVVLEQYHQGCRMVRMCTDNSSAL